MAWAARSGFGLAINAFWREHKTGFRKGTKRCNEGVQNGSEKLQNAAMKGFKTGLVS